MDDGGEALIGLVGAHGDAFEFLELAEEVFDQVPPLVEFGIERKRSRTSRMLRDDDLGAALVQRGNDGIAVEGLVGDQSAEGDSVDQRSDADRNPGSRTKRTRLPSASVNARILVVMPPLERPIAWLWVPLLRPVRGGGP